MMPCPQPGRGKASQRRERASPASLRARAASRRGLVRWLRPVGPFGTRAGSEHWPRALAYPPQSTALPLAFAEATMRGPLGEHALTTREIFRCPCAKETQTLAARR